MTWPTSQDWNEAIQNPRTAFSDADLQASQPVLTALGMPRPFSGNFADVYQVTGPDGRAWAIKCFTRPVPSDMERRYATIAGHLNQAQLPFTIPFQYLPQGIRSRGQIYPVVKMPWVDGMPMNQFVREHLHRATLLEAMLARWVKLCRRLRETGMAHGDLQHGNVLLVPGKANTLELKLVDYDGMFVPALAGQPSGEAGHAAFQHPERQTRVIYSADLDRFPHLVVATALRGLLIGGESLWKEFDNGDNLLFTREDFLQPGRSRVFRTLWDTGDPFTVGLVAHLVLSSVHPLARTPWLDQLMPEGHPPILTPSQERQAAAILNVPVAASYPVPGTPGPPPYYPPYPPPGYPPPPGFPPPMGPPAHGQHPAPAASPSPFPVSEIPLRTPRPVSGKRFLAFAGLIGLLLIGALVGVSMVVLSTDPNRNPRGTTQPATEPLASAEPEPAPATTAPPTDTPMAPSIQGPGGNTPPLQTPTTTPSKPAEAPIIRPSWSKPWGNNLTAAAHLILSADGSRILASDAQAARVAAWDTRTGRALPPVMLDVPSARGIPVTALQGKQVLLAIPGEPAWIVMDVGSGERSRFPAPVGIPTVSRVSTSRDGRFLLMQGPGRYEVLDVDNLGAQPLQRDAADPPSAVLAADGSRVVLVEASGKIQFYTLPEQTPTLALDIPAFPQPFVQAIGQVTPLLALRNAPAGKPGSDLAIYHWESAQVVQTLRGGQPNVPPIFAGNDRVLLFAAGNELQVWNTTTWASVATHRLPAVITHLAVSSDDQRVVLATADRQLHQVELHLPKVPGQNNLAKNTNPATPAAMAGMTSPRPMRKPVPGDAALTQAQASIQSIYASDLAKKLPAERRRLAEVLFTQAQESLESANRYALFKQAATLAGESGDLEFVFRVIDALTEEFATDGGDEALSAMELAFTATKQPAQVRTLAETALARADHLADQDQYVQARALCARLAERMREANQPTLAQEATEREKQIQALEEAFAPIRVALQKLMDNPMDADAALTVGRHRCLFQDRWEEGLPLLTQGSDATYKALASMELQAEMDPDTSDLARGERWSEAAKTRPEPEQAQFQARARYWYARALTSLPGGVELEQARQKLSFTQGASSTAPACLAKCTRCSTRCNNTAARGGSSRS